MIGETSAQEKEKFLLGHDISGEQLGASRPSGLSHQVV
jgi:hypothetical protein